MVEVGDHYEPVDETPATDHHPGVYRVVGVPDDVTLLRITDEDGRRVHTGEIRHVDSQTLSAEFEQVENPNAGISPVSDFQNLLSGMYWSVRRFL